MMPFGITSWIDRPLPSTSKPPSYWFAATAPPHRKPSGNTLLIMKLLVVLKGAGRRRLAPASGQGIRQ